MRAQMIVHMCMGACVRMLAVVNRRWGRAVGVRIRVFPRCWRRRRLLLLLLLLLGLVVLERLQRV